MMNIINFPSLQIHGGGSGGLATIVDSWLAFIENLLNKTPPEVFNILMPGIAGLENVHPLFVHYPIALLTVFFGVDLIGTLTKKRQLRYVASCLLYMGTFCTILTVFAGIVASESVEHVEAVHEIMERHEARGLAVLALSLFLSAWRMLHWGMNSIAINGVFLALSALLCLFVILGADLGGLMVYRYGVSVTVPSNRSSIQKIPSEDHSLTEDHEIEHDHDGHTHHHTH